MRPKVSQHEEHQLQSGRTPLSSFIDMKNELVRPGDVPDWKHFNEKFSESFHESQGRPDLPTRLMVGLTYLKYLHNLSDDKVVKRFLDSPYWQYFCGFIYFQKQAPLEASGLTRFRGRLGEEGAEELLKQTVEVAGRVGLLKKGSLRKVVVDTTAQYREIKSGLEA